MDISFEDILNEILDEGTIKVKGGFENKGKNPQGKPHVFKSKKAADAQRRAMFANGYKA